MSGVITPLGIYLKRFTLSASLFVDVTLSASLYVDVSPIVC